MKLETILNIEYKYLLLFLLLFGNLKIYYII